MTAMPPLTPEQKRPTNIDVDIRKREVRITWADGFRSVYPLDYLRKICPCAGCNEQRNNQDPLRVLKADQVRASGDLVADSPVEMVGNYALQFFWADGHRTGIYTFDFLRRLTPPQPADQ
jgi:DUF971 family protein